MQHSAAEVVQQVILAQKTNPLGGITVMSTIISYQVRKTGFSASVQPRLS